MTENEAATTGADSAAPLPTNIADLIREARQPAGEMFPLSGEAVRLRRALGVAQEWMASAWKGDPTGDLTHAAEYTQDQLEEELSRTAHEMEVLKRRREMRDVGQLEGADLDAAALNGTLSDALLAVYCVLRDLPDEEVGGASERERYALMGALMVAQDRANAEMPNAETAPEPPA